MRLEGAAPAEPEKVLVILSSLCMAPTAAEQEEESQLGMLIFHELTYLRNWVQAPVGLRGLGLKLEEQGGGGIESVSSLQG